MSKKNAVIPESWAELLAIPGVDLKPTPGKANKWEAERYSMLQALLGAGAIDWFAFETFRFAISRHRKFIPDFVYRDRQDGLCVWEVKGFRRDDAMVKLDVAAYQYPMVKFYLWEKVGKGKKMNWRGIWIEP